MFGSIQEEEYLKKLRNEKILVYGGIVFGFLLLVGILSYLFYRSKKAKKKDSSEQPEKNEKQTTIISDSI